MTSIVPSPGSRPAVLLTVGHGQASADEFAALLGDANVELIVDVRRFPASRAHPQFARDALAEWLPARGVDYRWEESFGGRRRLPVEAHAIDSWWTVEAFRAYAAYTRTAPFAEAMVRLLTDVPHQRTAVMCSESMWWRCHRRLIADIAVLVHGLEVHHLMPNGQLRTHAVAEGARLADNGAVVWDVTSRGGA